MSSQTSMQETTHIAASEKADAFVPEENIYWKDHLQQGFTTERRSLLWWVRHYIKRLHRVLKSAPGRLPYLLLHTVIFRLLYKICTYFPVNTHKVIFLSDGKTHLAGNFKCVYDALVEQYPSLRAWFLLKKTGHQKKTVKEHVQLAYHLATAKVILVDDVYTMIYYLNIRPGVELIQLWHAVGAFKTFGYSRIGRPGGPSLASKAHRNYTKAIVSSQSIAKHYAEAFGISEDKVIATGVPRTDVFFKKDYTESVQSRLHAAFPVLREKKVILYAPTFRGAGQAGAHFPMEMLDVEALYHSLHEEYVFIAKMHPFIKDEFVIPEPFKKFFYDFTEYPDVNELLCITDILITDYSSVCFEASLLNIPMLFYAFDLEEYRSSRDFYYLYENFVPGRIVRTTREIVQHIEEESFETQKLRPFVERFFNDTDGQSTQRVVNLVLKALA